MTQYHIDADPSAYSRFGLSSSIPWGVEEGEGVLIGEYEGRFAIFFV